MFSTLSIWPTQRRQNVFNIHRTEKCIYVNAPICKLKVHFFCTSCKGHHSSLDPTEHLFIYLGFWKPEMSLLLKHKFFLAIYSSFSHTSWSRNNPEAGLKQGMKMKLFLLSVEITALIFVFFFMKSSNRFVNS